MFSQLRECWVKYVSPRATPRWRGSSPVAASTPTPSRPQKPSVSAPITSNNRVQSGRVQKQKAPPAKKSTSWASYKLLDDSNDLPTTPANRIIPSVEDYESNEDTLMTDATPGDDDETLVDTPSGAEVDGYIDIAPERTRREKALDEIDHGDWTAVERRLFKKLNIRGFEPLLPQNWRMDFPTCPYILFTADKSRTFIRSMNGNEFRGEHSSFRHSPLVTYKSDWISLATRALFSLFEVGPRARDRLKAGLRPEQVLAKCIRSYVQWSLEDSDLINRDYIPALVVVAREPRESNKDIVARCQNKIHTIAQRYRDQENAKARELLDASDAFTLGTPESIVSNAYPTPLSNKSGKAKVKTIKKEKPDIETVKLETPRKKRKSTKEPITLYGIIIAHTIVCFVTYDVSYPDKAPRTLALFDFGDPGNDVWNAFAVAIMVVWARNFLLSRDPPRVTNRIEIDDPDL